MIDLLLAASGSLQERNIWAQSGWMTYHPAAGPGGSMGKRRRKEAADDRGRVRCVRRRAGTQHVERIIRIELELVQLGGHINCPASGR